MKFASTEFEEQPFLDIEEEDGWADDKKYFGDDAISNSDLRVFAVEGPAVFAAYKWCPDFVKKDPTESQEFGTLLHTLIYEEDQFKKRYSMFSGNLPKSAQMKKFCVDISEGIDLVTAYCNNYSMKNKSDSEITSKAEFLYDEMSAYISSLARLGNRKIITGDQYNNVKVAVKNYDGHPKVIEFRYILSRGKSLHLTEEAIYWKSNHGFDCRGKVDEIIIDHKKKVIYKNDLKSTYNSNPNSFGLTFQRGEEITLTGSLAKWGYDEQVAFYNKALLESDFCERHDCVGYTIENRIFAVRNTFPFNVNCYFMRDVVIEKAMEKINKKMDDIALFLATGNKDISNWNDYKFVRNNEFVL